MTRRIVGWILSIALHGGVLAMAIWNPQMGEPRLNLSVPVYHVDLVNLQPPAKGVPNPAKKKETPAAKKSNPDNKAAKATPKPETKPAPKPLPVAKPEPEPVQPKAKPISAKKKDPLPEKARPKPVQDKKKPKPVKQPVKAAVKPKKPKPKPKPKKKGPTREQLLARALKSAKRSVATQEKKDRRNLKNELAQLRKDVDSGSVPDSEGVEGVENGVDGGVQGGVVLEEAYAAIVAQIIKEKWRYPNQATRGSLVCLIEIRLDNDGTILDYVVLQPSGRPDYDASCLKAAAETGMVPAPPKPELQVLRINFNSSEDLSS